MAYNSLSDFIDALKKINEIKTIEKKVSSYLEISKITDEESKKKGGGKALFFKNVEDSEFPVAINLFGSEKRIALAFNVKNLDEIGDRLEKYLNFNPPSSFKNFLNLIPMALNIKNFFPKIVKRNSNAPCQEIVLKEKNINLFKIPVLHCWPKDAGRFVTLPLVFTKSLKTGKRNVGMYRLQIFDKNTTGMHWHIHKDGSHYFNEYKKENKKMPVAVAIGADPATIYSATAPMPRGIDEMLLAGFIRKKPVKMVKCITIDLEVPMEAEFVLEGYVDPEELRKEGPFGDHTGYYSLADLYPVFHITAITHKKNAIYNATLVGRPPMEDCYLAKATERFFLPMLKTVMPEIKDYFLPWEGVFHNIVIVSIQKEFEGHAHKIINGLWGQGQMSLCKAIVVVDENINPSNYKEILEKILNNLDISQDILISYGVLDVLDHSSPSVNSGSKIGIDLTEKIKEEKKREAIVLKENNINVKELKKKIEANGIEVIKIKTGKYEPHQRNRIVFISVQKKFSAKEFAEKIFKIKETHPFNIFLLFDKNINIEESSLCLWKLFNNVDPKRDIIIQNQKCLIDACKKGAVDGHFREWPDEMVF